MLTPQSIKDQEFQIKFRGYDAIEVKAYLELLAEDFFELTEQNRLQAEEIEALKAGQESLQRENETLTAEVKLSRENADGIQIEIEEGFKHKDKELGELRVQLEDARAAIASLEADNDKYRQQVLGLEAKLDGGQGASILEQAENGKLRAKLALLEEQITELKQQGLDFKTTILTAQKFADNLRQTSEVEAQQMMAKARADVQKFRNEAHAELSRLPKEIEALNKKRLKVRDELREVLHSYLEGLEVFSDTDSPEKEDDLSDLFESIRIPDGETVDPDDIESINMDLA